jgi:hypothetical protein
MIDKEIAAIIIISTITWGRVLILVLPNISTLQTDNNTRNLLFTSFYYNFMSNPFERRTELPMLTSKPSANGLL